MPISFVTFLCSSVHLQVSLQLHHTDLCEIPYLGFLLKFIDPLQFRLTPDKMTLHMKAYILMILTPVTCLHNRDSLFYVRNENIDYGLL